jgi:hypothetical protein
VSFRVTLLIFGLAVGLGILVAAPILVRPAAAGEKPPEQDTHPMTAMCRGFGPHIDGSPGEPPEVEAVHEA